LDGLDLLLGQKVTEREIGSEHEQDIGVVDGIPASSVSEEPGHPDGVRIVMFEPLFALQRETHRRLQLQSELPGFRLRVAAPVPAENRNGGRLIDQGGHGGEVGV
jgi:hypothetical protein